MLDFLNNYYILTSQLTRRLKKLTYTIDELLDLFTKTKNFLPKDIIFDSIIDSEPGLEQDIKKILIEQDTDFCFDTRISDKLTNILSKLEKQAGISCIPFHLYSPRKMNDFHRKIKEDQKSLDKQEIKYNLAAHAAINMQLRIMEVAIQKIKALSEKK